MQAMTLGLRVLPYCRPWALPQVLELEQYPALAAARERSCLLIAQMQACLTDLLSCVPEVETVAVSGSLGRLEAGPHSDGDLIVVLADKVPPGPARTAVMPAVWDALAPLGLPQPKGTGIFTTPVTRPELCDTASLGQVVEDVGIFGKRIQLLLDTQPVFKPPTCAAVLRAVVQRYATGFVARDPSKEWVHLLNDLVRYFRSLCLEAQWNFSQQRGGWYLRNLKLRHSRVLNYAGLLFLLGECSREKSDKVGWLIDRLSLTPLERVAEVYRARSETGFERVASAYELFLKRMHDPATRSELAAAAPATAQELSSGGPPVYAELHANSRALIGELVRFLLARRADWGERFFEYLLF
jgi:hypothetical protein